MKFTLALLCASLLTFVMAETVEEAWAAYKLNPNKELSLGYVGADGIVKDAGEIQDFERFKKNWIEAKAFNSQYATTEDAWTAYKVKTCQLLTKITKLKLFMNRLNVIRTTHKKKTQCGSKSSSGNGKIFWPTTKDTREAKFTIQSIRDTIWMRPKRSESSA